MIMKAVRIIIFILCFLQIIFPFLDYFLYQWRNDSRYTLNPSLRVTFDYDAGFIFYSLDFTPNTFSEYIIKNFDTGERGSSAVKSFGLAADISLFIFNFQSYFIPSGSNALGLQDLFASSIIIARSVYILMMYAFLYIVTLPIGLCLDIFTGGKKREKF